MNLVRDRDVLSGAVLAALGMFILSEARGWSYIGPDGPGPGFFPTWYGIAMIALSLALVVKAAVRPDPEARTPIDWRGTGRALGTWAAFAGSIALMAPLGFPVSFALLTLFVVVVVMGKPLLAGLATAIGLAAGFWGVFTAALGVELPKGTVWPPLLAAIGIG
jgi:putative tricarboxylic transport membrane protein